MKDSLKNKKILLVGGGSGGHTTPLVAVGRELLEDGADLAVVGDQWAAGAAAALGVTYYPLVSGKIRRYWSLRNILAPFETLVGYRLAGQILNEFQPDLVFSKGGHVSLPVVHQAHRRKIPIVVHDSDAVMGLSNSWAARWAGAICTGFSKEFYPAELADRVVETGIPVRTEFYTPTSSKPKKINRRPQILVTAGSQGSQSINNVILGALPRLSEYQIVHVTGASDYQRVAEKAASNYQVMPTTEVMAQLMVESDLVISRSGAATLAEMALLGRPAILVPLPMAANNHALANAMVWGKAGAGVVVYQEDFTSDWLIKTLERLFADRNQLARMGKAAKQLAYPKATEAIVSVIKTTIAPKSK